MDTITESELPNVILDYLTHMEADFETAHDEYKAIVHYYSDHKSNLLIEKEVRQQLDLLHLLEMTKEQLLSSTPEMLANVFNFTDMDYSIGIIVRYLKKWEFIRTSMDCMMNMTRFM